MAFVALATLASCELDRYPLTNFSEDTFFDKEENTKLALMVYTVAVSPMEWTTALPIGGHTAQKY